MFFFDPVTYQQLISKVLSKIVFFINHVDMCAIYITMETCSKIQHVVFNNIFIYQGQTYSYAKKSIVRERGVASL